VFRSKYLNVLDWVFGNEGHLEQRIRHVPSTRSFLALPPSDASTNALSSHALREDSPTSDGEAE
jgi:hypothetical protein